MRRPGPLQALRGLVAGVLTTFLALLFHVIGGGVAPTPLAVALCAAAVCWVAMLVGRARPSLPLLLVSVALAQGVLHTAFSIATASATVSGQAHAGHDHLLVVVTDHGHAMWPAHVLAGVCTVVAVRRGEAVLRRLLEIARVAARALLRLVLAALAAPAQPLARRGARPAEAPAGPLASWWLGSIVQRRGPPALAA